MIKNKFLALAMAAAMTLATAVPAFATGNETTVSITVAPKNNYTMTVPSATTLNSDGTATALSGGIQITNGDLEEGKKITVTATSANNWNMTASGVDTTIGYGLYSDSAAETAATTWEFTEEEANTGTTGATKNVYAKANATDVTKAASGTYSDVITFEAEVVNATVAVDSVSLNMNDVRAEVDMTVPLEATVSPANATDKTVTWTTDNDNVATVSPDGVVTTVGEGYATITATAGGKQATCNVTVKNGGDEF